MSNPPPNEKSTKAKKAEDRYSQALDSSKIIQKMFHSKSTKISEEAGLSMGGSEVSDGKDTENGNLQERDRDKVE